MQDAVTIAVVGRPRQIVFPAVCANCARPASVRLRIQKVLVTEDSEHFRDANQKRLWSSRHPAAVRAFVLKYWAVRIFIAALAVAAVFWVADELGIRLWEVLKYGW